jgi:hypothetical protein
VTAFRSQTDAMLAAKFDPEPYRTRGGLRSPDEAGFPGARHYFDPRPEFIPSREVYGYNTAGERTWTGWSGGREPRPEDEWTPEQIDHACKVLTRLAALA